MQAFAFLGIVYLAIVAWPLARTDWREHRLPNKYVLPAVPITLVGQLVVAVFNNEWLRLMLAVGIACIAFAASLLINRYASLGMGDVKLIAVMTLCLAWFSPLLPLVALLAAFALATAVIIGLLIARKTRMGSSIALGPYLLVGFFTAVIAQGWS